MASRSREYETRTINYKMVLESMGRMGLFHALIVEVRCLYILVHTCKTVYQEEWILLFIIDSLII